MIDYLLGFVQAHPMVSLALLFIAFRIYSMFSLKEEVIEGSRVVTVDKEDELKNQLNDNKIVVIDFYADWCPGCVRSSPEFARMSKRYTNVRFLKINTDIARSIASAHAIQALPTFKIISHKKEIASIVGFDKGDLISKLETAGGVSISG